MGKRRQADVGEQITGETSFFWNLLFVTTLLRNVLELIIYNNKVPETGHIVSL